MQYVVEPPTLNQYIILYTVETLKLMWTLYWDLASGECPVCSRVMGFICACVQYYFGQSRPLGKPLLQI